MEKEKSYETLLILRAQMEYIIFKEFIKGYDMPDGLKQAHIMTILKLKHIKMVSMSELSYALNMEKSSVTSVADKLLALGYIKSERSKEDRRVYHIKLTKKGEEFAEIFSQKHMEYISENLDELDSSSREKFFESIEFISNTFNKLSITQKFLK